MRNLTQIPSCIKTNDVVVRLSQHLAVHLYVLSASYTFFHAKMPKHAERDFVYALLRKTQLRNILLRAIHIRVRCG